MTILSEAVLRQHSEEVQKALDAVDGLRRDLAIAQGENSELKAANAGLRERNKGLEHMAQYTSGRVVELQTRLRALSEASAQALADSQEHHDQDIEAAIKDWAAVHVKKDDNSPHTTESGA